MYSLFGQNITGKWYEIQNANSSLEINIEKNNDNDFGTFNWELKGWANIINAPLKNLRTILFSLI
jgi:hypothetical protein